MTVRIKIKQGDYGMDYVFTIEDVDLSSINGFTATLEVWKGTTILVTGGVCTNIYQGGNTVVTHTVVDGDFDTVGEWDAEIEFTKAQYKESTDTFIWEVLETGS